MGIKEFFLGQKAEDVVLDPQFAERKKEMEGLRGVFAKEAIGDQPSAAEQAILESGERAAEAVGEQAMARARGARGFGRVAAESQARGLAAQFGQKALAEAGQEAALQRTRSTEAARGGLMQALQIEEQMMAREEAERERKRKKGMLPLAWSLGGALLGGKLGGPEGAKAGAQAGGLMGTGVVQSLQ